MSQNVPVSGWAGIEEGHETPAAPHAPRLGVAVVRTRPMPRMRRTEHLVVGSVDGGAHVLQRRGRDLLLGSSLLMLPMVGLYVLLAVVAYGQFDRFESLVGDHGYLGVERGLGLLAIVVQSLTAHIVGGYASLYLVRYQLGGEPRMGPTMKTLGQRLPTLIATWLVVRGVPLALVGLIYLNASGGSVTTLMVVFSPLLVLFVAWTVFITPVVMCETEGFGAISRARRLAGTRMGGVYAFVWASTFMAAVLFASISALPNLAESSGLITFGPYGWLIQGLAAPAALIVVMPFSAVATAQAYLQTRVQAEGLDIVLAADRAFGVHR